MNKKTAIVTGGTSNDVPAMACLVMNVKDTNPNLADEIVIFHDGICQKDQKLINNIFPTRFILYKSPFDDIKKFEDVVAKYFSLMVFCKYECFRLLDDYEYVIWTDYDVVILGDLSELKSPAVSGIKMVYTGIVKDSFVKDYSAEYLSKYDLTKTGISTPYFCLFDYLNDYKKLYSWCIDKTRVFANYLYLPEQAIFGLLIQEFNLNVNNIFSKEYCVHPVKDKNSKNKKILHAYGQPKFWNGIYNKIWETNYKKWIKLGGTPYEHRILKNKLKALLKKTFFYKLYAIIKRKLK